MVTAAGRQLTEQHRRTQLALRAVTIRDMMALWPAFDLDGIDRTWPPLQAALVTLILARRANSSGIAANYYRSLRTAEGVPGRPEPRLAPPPDRTLLTATLALVGPIQAKKNLTARRPDVAATTLVRLSGSVTRQVLDGGRKTLEVSTRADPRARGWRRVTSASPCDFCAGIASEGIHSEGGGFPAHDHCGCAAAPVFD